MEAWQKDHSRNPPTGKPTWKLSYLRLNKWRPVMRKTSEYPPRWNSLWGNFQKHIVKRLPSAFSFFSSYFLLCSFIFKTEPTLRKLQQRKTYSFVLFGNDEFQQCGLSIKNGKDFCLTVRYYLLIYAISSLWTSTIFWGRLTVVFQSLLHSEEGR